MNGGFWQPCASEVAFTTSVKNADLIAKANLAVWEAVRGLAESRDPLGTVITGIDADTLNAFGLARRNEILPALQTSVAVWSLRFTSTDTGAGLSATGLMDTTKLFGHILQTFGGQAPVRYLTSPGSGQPVLPHQVSVDTSPTNTKLIEKANLAIWDACRSLAQSRDPLGPTLLGMDEDTLTALGLSSKSRILPIMQTGVPLWLVTIGSAEMVQELVANGGYNTEKLFAQVLKMIDVNSTPRRS